VGCGDAQFPYLTTITVNPATPSVAAGRTQQFTALGTFSNGATRDMTSLVTWTSSAAPVATINSAGLAQTYSAGATTISASFTSPAAGTVTGSVTFTVTAPALVTVVVTDASAVIPGPTSLKTATTARGTGHQYLAYGVYSDGGERNITGSVTWSSTPLTVATITNAGLATGISAGTATITATDPTTSLSGTSSLVVTNATIVSTSVVVYPRVSQTIAPLTRQPFGALGVFSDGTTQDITADANWASTNPAAATVSNATPKGVATGVAVGTTVLQASFGGTTGQARLNVSSASLTSITLTPGTAGVAIGSTLLINAVGRFSDGTTQSINLATAWSVTPSNGSIATVDQTGLVTGIAAGSATVTAKFGTITANAVINVQALTSIAVTPATATIAQGTATQFVATATLADGTTQNVSASVTWIAISPPAVSGTPPVATISDVLGSSGWATGNAPGTAIIGAVFGGRASLSAVNVTGATLKTLAITPAGTVHVGLGVSQQYQATGTFSDSTTQNLTNQVTWISSVPGVAYINLTGLATNTGPGTTNISAVGNINGNAATSQVAVFANP
jgi:hypothetical protein